MQPLSVRVVDDAVLYPTIRVASRPGQLLMGVYDGDGAYVDGTVLDRRSGEKGAPVPRELYGSVKESQQPEAIYAGVLYFHFGHFLLESLARTWYARSHPELPLVWAGQHDWQKMRLRRWQTEILRLLGLENPTRIVADPTRFARLHVPDVGYRYDDWFHPEHAAFLGRYEGPAQVPGSRLWLSRTRIESEVRDLNGGAAERWLAEAGWRILHPEALSVRAQLDALSSAETVAGDEGSAFHALLLLADVTGKKFQIMRRHGPEHPNMHTIGDARHVDQVFHDVDGEVVLEAKGRAVSKISPRASGVLDVLQIPVGDVGAAAPHWTDGIVGRTLAGLEPQRLLDVGAVSSQPVVASLAPVRVAVSTRLDVDPRVLTAAGVEVYELGLEQYADLFHEGQEPFDVIRVTGAGLEDVMESFRASQRLADAGTVWVLGAGELAARAALAVRLLDPGYAAVKVLVQRKVVFVVLQAPDAPADVSDVLRMSTAEVGQRLRWLRPARLTRLRTGRTAILDPVEAEAEAEAEAETGTAAPPPPPPSAR